jgi:hypothetical protein
MDAARDEAEDEDEDEAKVDPVNLIVRPAAGQPRMHGTKISTTTGARKLPTASEEVLSR